jgi:DnaJ-class molecular chaperone
MSRHHHHRRRRGQTGTGREATEDEAREIHGVKAGATIEEIKAAYLKLMSIVHPDHRGSNHFAKELNAAKAVLMGE